MIRALVLALAASAAAICAAQAQTTATPYPVYDTSDSWGLSNAGVPAGPYIKGGGGYSWSINGTYNNSYIAGGGLGFRFAPFFRMDATFDYRGGYRAAQFNDTSFTDWSAMLNAYFDFNIPFIRPLIPYIGAGGGVAQNRLNGTTVTVSGTEVASLSGSSKYQAAWQLMAGGSYYLTPNVALDVAYRFFYGGSGINTTGTGFPTKSGDFKANEVVGYLRFGF